MMLPSADMVTANPVQRCLLIERRGLTMPAAEVTPDAQSLLQSMGRVRVVTRHASHGPEFGERVGLAVPAAGVAVNGQSFLQGLCRVRVVTRHASRGPELGEGVGLAVRVAGATVDFQ